jgi:hypothetical protein
MQSAHVCRQAQDFGGSLSVQSEMGSPLKKQKPFSGAINLEPITPLASGLELSPSSSRPHAEKAAKIDDEL